MSYSIERLQNPPTYLNALHADFDIKTEIQEYSAKLIRFLNEETTAVSIILNVLDFPLGLDTLMNATKIAMNVNENPYDHPNAKQLILVSRNPLIKVSIDGFRILGIAKNIQIAESVEAALLLV